MIVFGIFFIYSACYIRDDLEVVPLYKKQIMWSFVGMASYIFFSVYDYRKFRKLASWIYSFCIILLLLVLMVGVTKYGGKRWLSIAGVQIQPSELMKLGMMIFLASFLSNPRINLGDWRVFATSIAIAVVPFGLIAMQPDLGTAMVLLPVAFMMMFVGGVPVKYLGSIVAIGLVGLTLLMALLILPEKLGATEETQEKVMNAIGLKEHQKKRIMVYLNLDKDPLGAGWNKTQSKIAVGSGGALGKGWCKGRQNVLGFLPRSVAPTDFIYSVIAEEKGFVGSMIVLLLYGTIITFGLYGAMISRDRMGRILCTGIVTMIFTHVFINIAMTIGLMPITGLPLPLLSYGGTFTVAIMTSLGMIQSVFIRSRRTDMFSQTASGSVGYAG
ncbi:rod shape-determining protein RodA [bacterium E08(2017)]|nr:rod shape-determining protein RodA [bacterium E08(2017)]